jgi:two-component system, NarL family, sensor histidine kinase UhpB
MAFPIRLLHVEERPEHAELVRAALRRASFAFTSDRVEGEREFVAALDEGTPDAILCDYDMPKFTAERALRILRARDLDVPFIVVSSYIGEGAAVVAMQNGAFDYVAKRDLGRLPRAIEAAIERGKARREKARAQSARRDNETMNHSILDSLDARIAVIDGDGVILAVNKSWELFDSGRSELGLGNANVGSNYLDMLRDAARGGRAFAQEGLQAIPSVLARERAFASLEYEVPSELGMRWFLVRATPLAGSEHGAVLSHIEITDRMLNLMELRTAHKRLQNLSTRILSVQEDERRTIASELHDDVGQSLTALKISLHRLAEGQVRDSAALIGECLLVAGETLERLRRLVHDLRPPQLDELGLADALGWLVERQREATGIEIRFSVAGVEDRRPPARIEVACYRIAQEGLSNATRHSQARHIFVSLAFEDLLLKLVIHDDGSGFDEAAARHAAIMSGSLGLVGMQERARLAGGELNLRTVVRGGTMLIATFPLMPEPSDEELEPLLE